MQRELAVPLTPDLAGGSIRLQTVTAAYGDTISGTFTVDNRGGAAASAFAVQVVLSPDNLFSQYFLVLTTFALPGLRAGQEFASGVFPMSLPDLTQATAAGLPVSGPVYLGLRIDPTGVVPELNPHAQSGVHAGEDWQAVTVVTPFTFRGINHSPANAEVLGDPNSRVNGMLAEGQSDWYQITVSTSGLLTATVTAPAGSLLAPRLTLAGPSGQVLIQSDDGSLLQHLPPGTYEVAVSARSGAGRYQLTVESIPASAPFEKLSVGDLPSSVAVADVNGDGRPDLIVANDGDKTVSVLLGNGDGTFQNQNTFSVGYSPISVAVADVNGDGRPDLVVANYSDPFGDVLHLQGKGDGTFQIAGRRTTLAVQQLSNGQTDVLVADQQGDRVDIQSAQPGDSQLTPIVILADGTHSTLAPGAVQWAKLDKDSPYYDAIVVASGGNEVLVYRGTGFDSAAGAPTFAAPVSYPVGTNPVSVTIQDLNGDSIPDLIVTNQGSNDVSLLFGSWDASGTWVGTAGPRLKSRGSGPIAAQAVFPADGGLAQLVITNGQSGTLAVLPGVGQGFFNDQNPPIVNLPGNPVLTQGPTFFGSSSSGVLLRATGQLLGFNLDDLAGSIGVVFAPAGDEVAAAQALADGHVVAVLSSGTVVDLAPVEGGLGVDSTLVPLTGIPSEPSALAVLQEESGMQVLVTAAGGDRVFAFGILEPPGAPVLPEPSVGPVVEVTPLAGEPLTVVVTLTAGTGPAGGVTTSAAAALPTGNEIGAEAVDESSAGQLVPGLSALGAAPPGWSLGLLTRLLSSAPVEDAAGEVVVEVVPKPVAAAEKPRPAVDGLDLDKLLRELDLYQPTPSPERPGPISGRLREQRGQERIAWTPSAAIKTLLADLVVAVSAADREAGSPPAEMSDTVLVQTPSSWSEERWRLLGLAGLALWPWPSCGFQSDGETQRTPERSRGRLGNGRAEPRQSRMGVHEER
jgi:hypothetical protein